MIFKNIFVNNLYFFELSILFITNGLIIFVLFILLIVLILLSRRSPKGEAYSLSMNDEDFEDNIKILALSLRSGESVGVMPNINLYLRKIKKKIKMIS